MYMNASPLGLAHLVPVHFAATGSVKSSCPESLSSSNIQTHGEPEPSPDRWPATTRCRIAESIHVCEEGVQKNPPNFNSFALKKWVSPKVFTWASPPDDKPSRNS